MMMGASHGLYSYECVKSAGDEMVAFVGSLSESITFLAPSLARAGPQLPYRGFYYLGFYLAGLEEVKYKGIAGE